MFRESFRHLPKIERRRITMPPHRLRLNRLEMVEPMKADDIEALRASLPLDHLEHYPDYPTFIERLAGELLVPEETIVLGPGIEEFLRALIAMADREILIQARTCAMHRVYGEVFRRPMCEIHGNPRVPMSVDALCNQLDNRVGMLIWANPGQPVQDYIPPQAMRQVARRAKVLGIVLVIDEAYFGFGAESCIELADEFSNVVVLRSFSKSEGLASCRIAYAVAQPPLISYLNGVRQSGEVSGLSMHIAEWLMDRPYIGMERRARVREGRDWLVNRLWNEGFPTYGRWGNSVLIDCKSEARASLVQTLLEASGVLVRVVGCHLMVACGGVPVMQDFHGEFIGAWNTCSRQIEKG